METSQLIKEFYSIQEERVKAYTTFNSAHLEYLSTAPNYDFAKYRSQVNLVTEQFTALSRRVIQLIGQLRENQVESVAAVLEKLQAVEKEKLEMTVQQQLLSKTITDQAAVEGNEEEKEVTEERNRQLRRSMAAVESKMAELMEELKYESEEYLLEGT
ncbi:required for excision 1-B domain-containing protein-like [Dysidea avara]|uniref:required for excision 1-B domain-containing protein-like n=1 Tax=Dysidea avara TaxID=196820 RepID=UPI003324F5E9